MTYKRDKKLILVIHKPWAELNIFFVLKVVLLCKWYLSFILDKYFFIHQRYRKANRFDDNFDVLIPFTDIQSRRGGVFMYEMKEQRF